MGGYVPAESYGEKLLQRRIEEAVKAVRHGGGVRTTAFLNEREQELAVARLNREYWPHYAFDGGYGRAQRQLLCVFAPQETPVFPIDVLRIAPRPGANTLTHRDYLGAILALGLKRECVGDIVAGDEGAVVFVQPALTTFLRQELREVGRVSVTVELCDHPPGEIQARPAQAGSASVASMRLDAVLAAMLNTSRTEAAALVKQGLVRVNQLPVQNGHRELGAGDVLSVRGEGKFQLSGLGGTSRKGRQFIEFLRYR